MFAENVDLMVCVAMVFRGENKDWIGPWMTFCEKPTITVGMSYYMHSIPVSRLKPILDDADRRSLRHSDWFKLKMIMAFSINKLFPRIPQLPPKTQFIKIKFINQGLDLLNISKIFRDHRGASKIPQYFENLDPPLICYQYKKKPLEISFSTTTKSLLTLMFGVLFNVLPLVRTRHFCIHLQAMLSRGTLPVSLTRDYGHF